MIFDVFDDVCLLQTARFVCCWDDWDDVHLSPLFTNRTHSRQGHLSSPNATTRKPSVQFVRWWMFIPPLRGWRNRDEVNFSLQPDPLSQALVCVRLPWEWGRLWNTLIWRWLQGLWANAWPALLTSTSQAEARRWIHLHSVRGWKQRAEWVFATSPQPISYFSAFIWELLKAVTGSPWVFFSLPAVAFVIGVGLWLNLDTGYAPSKDTAWSQQSTGAHAPPSAIRPSRRRIYTHTISRVFQWDPG